MDNGHMAQSLRKLIEELTGKQKHQACMYGIAKDNSEIWHDLQLEINITMKEIALKYGQPYSYLEKVNKVSSLGFSVGQIHLQNMPRAAPSMIRTTKLSENIYTYIQIIKESLEISKFGHNYKL